MSCIHITVCAGCKLDRAVRSDFPSHRQGDWTAPDQLLLTGHDWDLHYFYRRPCNESLVRDRQLRFWNPWTRVTSLWENYEVQVPTRNVAGQPRGRADWRSAPAGLVLHRLDLV